MRKVLGDVKPARTQTVAVQGGAKLDAIREANQCRAIPGLHHAGKILIKVLAIGFQTLSPNKSKGNK
jgi:hypothetical protein